MNASAFSCLHANPQVPHMETEEQQRKWSSHSSVIVNGLAQVEPRSLPIHSSILALFLYASVPLLMLKKTNSGEFLVPLHGCTVTEVLYER